MPQYRLGFRLLANLLGRDLVGEPAEDEHYEANGDSQQATSRGLMVWRKADNWTAFTDGYRTWINGPFGVQSRLNTELLPWEQPPEYRPTLFCHPSPSGQGRFWISPAGIILHGTRSGRRLDRFSEFHGTRGWAQSGADGLAWHVTVGEDCVATHLDPGQWGWHCGEPDSRRYLGIEFAQPTVEYDITDLQVRAAAWWIREVALERWPLMGLELRAHSEIEQGRESGKSDPYPDGDPRNWELADRIIRAL